MKPVPAVLSLLLLASTPCVAGEGHVAVYDGSVTLHSYVASPTPSPEVSTVHRQKIIIDLSTGQYAIYELTAGHGTKSFQQIVNSSAHRFGLPGPRNKPSTTIFITASGSDLAAPFEEQFSSSYVQMTGVDNPAKSKAAGLSVSAPASMSYQAVVASDVSADLGLPVLNAGTTFETSPGIFLLNVGLTKQNSGGADFSTAVTNLEAALTQLGYAAQ